MLESLSALPKNEYHTDLSPNTQKSHLKHQIVQHIPEILPIISNFKPRGISNDIPTFFLAEYGSSSIVMIPYDIYPLIAIPDQLSSFFYRLNVVPKTSKARIQLEDDKESFADLLLVLFEKRQILLDFLQRTPVSIERKYSNVSNASNVSVGNNMNHLVFGNLEGGTRRKKIKKRKSKTRVRRC